MRRRLATVLGLLAAMLALGVPAEDGKPGSGDFCGVAAGMVRGDV